MRNKPWMAIPLALAITLGMAGCDDGENDSPAAPSDGAEQAPATQPETNEISREGRTNQPEASNTTSESATNGDISAPTSSSSQENQSGNGGGVSSEMPVEKQQAPAGEPGDGPVTIDDNEAALAEPQGLGEEPQALPGETSKSDIDKFMEETERRFQEAQREIDEQFEEAEKADPTQGLEETPGSSTTPQGDANQQNGGN